MQSENKLKQLNISYKNFLDEMENPSCSSSVSLSHSAAVSLCKNGFGSNLFNAMLSFTVPIWIFLGILFAIMTNWKFIFLVIIIPVHFKIARRAIAKSVWKELLGDGKLPYDARENAYNLLVEHDQLWAENWATTAPLKEDKKVKRRAGDAKRT